MTTTQSTGSKVIKCAGGCGYTWLVPAHAPVTGNDMCSLCLDIYDDQAGDDHHQVISLGGRTCDVCGQEVNGQTDADGVPKMDGDAVYHT